MKNIIVSLITVAVAISCSKPAVDQKSLGGAVSGLLHYIAGDRIDADTLFYQNSVYFNGSCNSKEALGRSLQKDFSGLTDLSIKSEYRSLQDIQKITVLKAVCGGKVSYLVCAWLKIRGKWTIVYMSRGDSETAADLSDAIGKYDMFFNRHVVKDLMESCFAREICFVKGTNTVFGYDNVAKGLSFLESNFPYQFKTTIREKFQVSSDCFVLINQLQEINSGAKFAVIQVWRMTIDGARIVVAFDYV